jgi:predicted nucleic acid-binding Zn ribbon protein
MSSVRRGSLGYPIEPKVRTSGCASDGPREAGLARVLGRSRRRRAAPREKEPRKGLLQRLSRVAMRVPSLEVMTSRQCLSCGAPITVLARPDKTYCSGRCRTAAHRRRHGRNPRPAVELDTLAAQLEPAIAEATLVASIAFAARTDWRAAAHVLATRWPSRWGRRNQRGRDGEPLDFND